MCFTYTHDISSSVIGILCRIWYPCTEDGIFQSFHPNYSYHVIVGVYPMLVGVHPCVVYLEFICWPKIYAYGSLTM